MRQEGENFEKLFCHDWISPLGQLVAWLRENEKEEDCEAWVGGVLTVTLKAGPALGRRKRGFQGLLIRSLLLILKFKEQTKNSQETWESLCDYSPQAHIFEADTGLTLVWDFGEWRLCLGSGTNRRALLLPWDGVFFSISESLFHPGDKNQLTSMLSSLLELPGNSSQIQSFIY